MKNKGLLLLQSAYEEVVSLREWCLAMLKACEQTTDLLTADATNSRFIEFISTTLVAGPRVVGFGPRISLTNTLTQQELLIQALERIHKREGSGKNVLTLGCSNMSSNPSAQVCASRSFESVFPNQSHTLLLQGHWRTLLKRVGDDLMLLLLSTRSVFYPVNSSCYLQLTGTPIYDLWPLLRGAHISLADKPTHPHHSKACKTLNRLTDRRTKQPTSGEAKAAGKQGASQRITRKRKREVTSCSESCDIKRSCAWASEEITTRWQRDLNTGFCASDDDNGGDGGCGEMDWSGSTEDQSAENASMHESLYITALDFQSQIPETSLKSPAENTGTRLVTAAQIPETSLECVDFTDTMVPQSTRVGQVIANVNCDSETQGSLGKGKGPLGERQDKTEEVRNHNLPQRNGAVANSQSFTPYDYHTPLPRPRLLYARCLREGISSLSPLSGPTNVATNDLITCRVTRIHRDKQNLGMLKCRGVIEERLCGMMDRVLRNHRKISYNKVLSQFIPLANHRKQRKGLVMPSIREGGVPENQSERSDIQEKQGTTGEMAALLSQYAPPRRVYLFLRRLLLTLGLRSLLGSQRNLQCLLKGVERLTLMGKVEKFSLGEIVSKMRIKDFRWLPRKLPHTAKEFIAAKVVYWLIDRYVFQILKGFFYITDSSVFRNRLFYYRKRVWSRVRSLALQDYLSTGMLAPLSTYEAHTSVTTDRALGVSRLRLLPKRTSVRPILNLGKRETKGPGKGLSINGQLQNIMQVLTHIKKQRPHLAGSSQFGAADVHATWRKFVADRRQRKDTRPLYFVKVDIANCYNSIDQDKLFNIVKDTLTQGSTSDEYIIRRFASIHLADGRPRRLFRRHVTSLEEFEPDGVKFLRQMCEEKGLKGTLFVDQVMHMHETNQHTLQRLAKHLFNNIIQVGGRYFRQAVGISQGSVLSTLLCSAYYGHMEALHLQVATDELLMRQVDDFLLITPHATHAQQFLKLMQTGIPEYNCVISPCKTLLNFAPEEGAGGQASAQAKQLPANALFPWCGVLINPCTLEVVMDYSRCAGLSLNNLVSFDSSQKLRHALHAKLLRGLTCRNLLLCLDPDVAGDHTIARELYKLFCVTALKYHACVQTLPASQGVKENPAFFLNLVLRLPECLRQHLEWKLLGFCVRRSVILSGCALQWLCLKAFITTLSRYQAIHGPNFMGPLRGLLVACQKHTSKELLEILLAVTKEFPKELTAMCI